MTDPIKPAPIVAIPNYPDVRVTVTTGCAGLWIVSKASGKQRLIAHWCRRDYT